MAKLIQIPFRIIVFLIGLSVAFSGILQFLAMIRLGGAHLGILGAIGAASVTWTICGLPALLCFSFFKGAPDIWNNDDLSRIFKVLGTIGVFILFVGLAHLISWGNGWLIGWIADLDCLKALEAGVSGSAPCR
jgi:hypothetical protein